MSSADYLALVAAFCLAVLVGNLANYIKARTDHSRAAAERERADARLLLAKARFDYGDMS